MRTCGKGELAFSISLLYCNPHYIEIREYLIFKLTSSITGQDNKMVLICGASPEIKLLGKTGSVTEFLDNMHLL